jgi:uncharacterized pyridoxal phosphate-containing UPF0001 family protein
MWMLLQLNELQLKSNAVKVKCTGIKWHYLGRLSRKKVKALLGMAQ